MRPALPTLALMLAALQTSPAFAQVRLIDAGIICPRESSGQLVDAPGTESGFIQQIDQGMTFDLPDRTVPTLDKLSFGFRTGLKPGEPAQEVVVVVTHPPMGVRGQTRQEWSDVITPGATSLNMFTFDEDYEKVVGAWTFSIEIGDQPAVTVAFDVTETENQGRIEQTCFQFLS